MVAAALLLSACQVDRLTGDWLQQPTTEPAAAAAAGPSLLAAPAHSVSGWVPYWGTESSRAAIAAYPGTVGDVSPLFYGANDDGTLRLLGPQAQLNATVQAARTAAQALGRIEVHKRFVGERVAKHRRIPVGDLSLIHI